MERKNYSEELKQEIVKLRRQGASYKEIVKLTGAPDTVVYRTCKSAGLVREKPQLSEQTKAKILELAPYMCASEIAATLDTTQGTVSRYLAKHGVKAKEWEGKAGRKPRFTKEKLEELYPKYTIKAIAQMYGVGENYIAKLVRDAGLRGKIADGICSHKCRSCIYRGRLDTVTPYCRYILVERKARGCPAGEKCDKYVKGKEREDMVLWYE